MAAPFFPTNPLLKQNGNGFNFWLQFAVVMACVALGGRLGGVGLGAAGGLGRYLSSFFSRNFPKKSLSIIQLPGRRPGP